MYIYINIYIYMYIYTCIVCFMSLSCKHWIIVHSDNSAFLPLVMKQRSAPSRFIDILELCRTRPINMDCAKQPPNTTFSVVLGVFLWEHTAIIQRCIKIQTNCVLAHTCICVYVCMCIVICVYTNYDMYLHISAHMHICVCVHVYNHGYTHACLYVNIYWCAATIGFLSLA